MMSKCFLRAIGLILAWCFAALAAASVWMAYIILRVPVYHGLDAARPSIGAKLDILSAPVLLGSIFALAWWTVLWRKRSAWKWGLAASCVAGGMGFLLASPASHLRIAGWPLLAVGAAGILVFALTRNESKSAKKPVRRPLPGDGTSKAVNTLTGILAAFAMIAVSQLWIGWAKTLGLPDDLPFGLFLLLLLIVIVAVMVIHEAGHVLVGLTQKMKLTMVGFGPLVWWWNECGKWKFQFHAAGFKSILAFVRVVPVELADFRRRKILQVAAGPGANIITGIAAAALLLATPRVPWGNASWLMLSTFATVSLVVGSFNLIPFAIGEGGYSDGAKLYHLLSGGFWADYHRMLGVVYSTGVSPVMPRDYDIDTIHLATDLVGEGDEGVFLRFSAYSYFLDRGEFNQAVEEISKTEQCCNDSGLELPTAWISVFVFANAFLRRDPVAARAWWEKLEDKSKKRKNPEGHWTSLAALLWSENRIEEATEALEKADVWARQLAESGFAEVERNSVRLVRQALDESEARERRTALEADPGKIEAMDGGPRVKVVSDPTLL